jgi:7,8-didemethyl-8-hydroxy-5-deazariboflavin synthase CofG subunit
MAQLASNPKNITFSPSFTLPVTRRCSNACLYCGFREAEGGVMDPVEVEAWLDRAREKDYSEVLIISGERVDEIPAIRKSLAERKFADFGRYVAAVCRLALQKGLLPHTNIGILAPPSLALLREVNASMGLMIENVDPAFGRSVHPHKIIEQRLATIENAGKLRIPFTTGILVGLGESPGSRMDSLDWIAGVHRRYGHIQEVILQNYVVNQQSHLQAFPLSLEEWIKLITFCREKMPEVKIQIPPNLNPLWPKLVLSGVDDLGGISGEIDYVNPQRPWESILFYQRHFPSGGFALVPRLPVYREYYQRTWFSQEVGPVLEAWIQRHEFRYYRQ